MPKSTHDVLFAGDPGACPYCHEAWQWVRPGKSQPNCDCSDEVIMSRWELRKIEKMLMNMKKMLKKDLRRLEK